MVGGRDEEALRQFLKRHHVHFTIDPEWVIARDGRRPVGFEIRLFAVHEKGARALPGCPKSRAVAGSLRSLVESILPACPTPARIEVEPFSPALYDSREVPGADEVAIEIRLSHAQHYADPVDESEERCLSQIRERFKLFTLPER